MKLKEFIDRFEALGDRAFLTNFNHPFLLQTGRVLDTGPTQEEREVFLIRVRQGKSLTVGRSPKSDVRINAGEVSSTHATLLPAEPDNEIEDWRVVDTDSTNGTFVDGVKIEPGAPIALKDTSSVRFGPDASFSFLLPESFLRVFRRMARDLNPDSNADYLLEKTNPELEVVRDFDAGEGKIVPVEEGGDALLLCCSPFDPIKLTLGNPVVIGRSPKTAMLVLPHKNVSRRHAEVERRADGVFLRDMGSANGTFIGKTKVGDQWIELLLGKEVSVGPYVITLEGPQEALTKTAVAKSPKRLTLHLNGNLKDVALLDLFNEIEQAQITGVLEISARKAKGQIFLRTGEPVDATVGKLSGEEALALFMALTEGEFIIHPDTDRWKGSERRITRSFSELALDEFFDAES